MADIVIRPTKKWIKFGYTATIIVICLALFAYNNFFPEATKWPVLAFALLLLWPASRHIQQRFTSMMISGDKLRYESGMLSKTMRTIQLSKVQDVRVDQSLVQRMMGIGNISIETSGETSRLGMDNVDDPQVVADEIVNAAQGQQFRSPSARKKGE